jgi:hypothetical protein
MPFEKSITCAMCGKTIGPQKQILFEVIDGVNYAFDSKDCIMFFKKFKSLYGGSFGARI